MCGDLLNISVKCLSVIKVSEAFFWLNLFSPFIELFATLSWFVVKIVLALP
jgi:hypothetical protein